MQYRIRIRVENKNKMTANDAQATKSDSLKNLTENCRKNDRKIFESSKGGNYYIRYIKILNKQQ